MNLLVALPVSHPAIESVEGVLSGEEPCSGTNGSFIRMAQLVASLGHRVVLTGSVAHGSGAVQVAPHSGVEPRAFDAIVAHQSHWQRDDGNFTFGQEALKRTRLWLHNASAWRVVGTFLRAGGHSIVCPTEFHANLYRALAGFHTRVAVAFNTCCSAFKPDWARSPQGNRLLFIGAITPTKGFRELMAVWSALTRRLEDVELYVAGSITLHRTMDGSGAGPGVADADFESKEIVPWIESLQQKHRPHFLGAIAPLQLRDEILRSRAVIVNPSWQAFETFCVAAVEAQVCGRPVFSVARGGLLDTVYRSPRLDTLAGTPGSEPLAGCIEKGFRDPRLLSQIGAEASEWCQARYNDQVIAAQWKQILDPELKWQRHRLLGVSWRDKFCDLLRLTGLGLTFERLALKR